ncbi:MAG: hypothetical protein V1824_00340 [archaeon]
MAKNEFSKKKIETAIKAISDVCLHCEKCQESKCGVYNAYGAIEELKK